MRLPPLNSLRAFEAAARHCSVGKAARELHVTPAAISHQIKALEEQLGMQVFKRLPRRIELTAAGEALLPQLTEAFALMRDAVLSVQQLKSAGRVVVSVPPALGTKWLVGKLPGFTAQYPDIDLSIAVRQSMVDQAVDAEATSGRVVEDVDIAIRLGHGDYPGYIVHKLFSPYAIPLCSPRLLEGQYALRQPDDLQHHTLLHYQSDIASLDVGRPTWSSWLKAAGVRDVMKNRGITFNNVVPAMEAAVDGMGVILGIPIVAATDIEAGRLVMPFSLGLRMGTSYFAVHRKTAERNPAIVAFRDWLVGEARSERWAEVHDSDTADTIVAED
ncbi:MAG: transcriptional regulator GcvA [Nevskiales bacterium]|nr:transcriptional regulator GcvA [Nevskiales bacterium]